MSHTLWFVSLSALLVGAAPRIPPPSPESEGAEPLPAPTPFQFDINDPMLQPAARAGREVKTWAEAWHVLTTTSQDLKTARANIDRAEGRWKQALSTVLPNARVTGQLAYDVLNPDRPALFGAGQGGGGGNLQGVVNGEEQRGPTSPTGIGIASLTQSIVDLGAWKGIGSANAAATSASEGFQDTRRRLTQGLARSLVAVVAAERVAELSRVGLRLALERATLSKRTQQLGAGTVLDVVRTRQDVEVARGQLINADEQLRRAREALGVALGLGEQVGVPAGFALDGLVKELQQQCKRLEHVDQRPDLVAATANLESAKDSRQQASFGYLPSLSLNSSLVGLTTDPGFGRFATWNVAAVLSFPLWEGGNREGLVRERKGLEVQADEALSARQRDVSIEVAQARRGVDVTRALRDAALGARSFAQRTDELTRRSFEVGRAGSLELVQTATALREADLALAAREFQWVQAGLDAYLTEARCDE